MLRRLFLLATVVLVLTAACAQADTAEDTTVVTSTTVPPTATTATTSTTQLATTTTTSTTQPPTTATTTSLPQTTTTFTAIGSLDSGLFCRDVSALGYGYADAVAYWTREGRPDRMDADRNGIPCETVYDHAAVVAFWGEPLPTTTSTTTDLWYSVATPDYQVASLPGAGGHYGSGCSPGSDTLPDGVWFGRVTTAEESKVAFDLMCFGPGSEGPGDITNSNPKLRTVPVDPVAVVHRVTDDGLGWHAVQYSTWLTIPASPFCVDGCMHWLYVNNDVITEAVELWFP
jgi:hypothetical protein